MTIGPLVDDEEPVALLHQSAVGEIDFLQVATDAGADGDLVDRLEAADELIIVDHIAHDRLGDGDGRGRRACWASSDER